MTEEERNNQEADAYRAAIPPLVALLRACGVIAYRGLMPTQGCVWQEVELDLGPLPSTEAGAEPPTQPEQPLDEPRGPDGLTKAEQELLYASSVR